MFRLYMDGLTAAVRPQSSMKYITSLSGRRGADLLAEVENMAAMQPFTPEESGRNAPSRNFGSFRGMF